MNKKCQFILLLISSVLIFSSCRSDGPSGVDITGLWSGDVYAAGGWTDGPVVFEISDDGSIKIGDVNDDVIYDEAIQQNFTWSLNENYMSITGWAYMYYMEFAYELSTDGNQLTLVMIRRNFFNETYDNLNTGDRIVLFKDETNDFNYYFGEDYDLNSSY